MPEAAIRCTYGQAYQTDDYDDHDLGGPPWQQAIGPCCHTNPSSPILEAV